MAAITKAMAAILAKPSGSNHTNYTSRSSSGSGRGSGTSTGTANSNVTKNNHTIFSYNNGSTNNVRSWHDDGSGRLGIGVGASVGSGVGTAHTNGVVDVMAVDQYLNVHTLQPNTTEKLLLDDYAQMNSDDGYQHLDSNHCEMLDVNTNLTYMNITCDSPLEYAIPLYGYCMPFLLTITMISNSLIVLVLSKKTMYTPTNYVLMGMAICDMLTVVFPAPGLWYMYTFGNHYKPLFPVSMCLAYGVFNEIMPAICHTISIWLTLALAVQRYIYVCHAPMARTWCTIPRVKRCTIYITICAFLHQATRFIDRVYYPIVIQWNGKKTKVCHVETADWVHDYVGEDLYFTCFYLFRVVFVHLLPCIILVWLNILLFRAMRQAQERRKLLFRENRKKECKKLRDSNCTTLMLIVVVTVFLIAEIPIAVVTALHIVSSLTIDFLDYSIANIFIMFTNFFLVVSYPINFGIYCGMSRQFRETFKEIFFGQNTVKKDNSSKYSIVNGQRTCTNTNETVL